MADETQVAKLRKLLDKAEKAGVPKRKLLKYRLALAVAERNAGAVDPALIIALITAITELIKLWLEKRNASEDSDD